MFFRRKKPNFYTLLSFTIFCFLGFNSLTLGETTNNDFIEPIVREGQKDCYFCSLPKPKNNVNLNQICGSNPYKVICDNDRARDYNHEMDEKISKTIKEARRKSLKSMGYNSLEEAVAEPLNKKGIRYDMKNPKFRQALKKGDVYNLPTSGRKKCSDKLEKYQNYNPSSQEPVNELRKVLGGLRESLEDEQAILNHLRSYSVGSFYDDFFRKCKDHANDNYEFIRQHSLHRKFRADCRKKSLDTMEGEVVELYRLDDSVASLQKKKDFINQYSYIDTLEGGASYRGPLHGTSNEIKILQHNIESERRVLQNICSSSLGWTERNVAGDILLDIYAEIQTNKVFIDHVFSELYGNNEIEDFRENAETTKRKTLESLPQIFPGSQNLQIIRNSVNQVDINIPSKPTKNLFSNRGGNLFLDKSKLEGHPSLNPNMLQSFFGSTLEESLKQFHAFYMPSLGRNSSTVSLSWKALQTNRHNPYTIFATFAHEFGHHFGAEVSAINGLSLKNEYKKILPCYSKRSSIKMKASQREEVSADYISASVIANELKLLPKNQRANVYVESLKDFCSFGKRSLGVCFSENDPHPHPHPRLRINGIYSAHPEIRKALGCSSEESSYEICP